MQNLFKFNFKHDFTYIVIGFFLSLFLTFISFMTVILYFEFNKIFINFFLLLCAILQTIIHVICFLHIDLSFKQKWNIISLFFTLVIIFILILGSLWIMDHLNHNVMHNFK